MRVGAQTHGDCKAVIFQLHHATFVSWDALIPPAVMAAVTVTDGETEAQRGWVTVSEGGVRIQTRLCSEPAHHPASQTTAWRRCRSRGKPSRA